MHIRRKLILCCLALISVGSVFAGSQVQSLALAAFSEDKEGESALDLEDYARAETIYRKRLASKSDAAQEGYLRTCLGESLLWQGRFSEAGKELKKGCSLINKTQSPLSDLRARVYDDLAWLDETRNDWASGIADSKIALSALRELPNADPVHLCEILEHLGSLSKEAGKFIDAADYYQQALDLRTKTFGPQNIQVADDQELLAAMLRKTGKSDQAKSLYAQAMQIKCSSQAAFVPYTPHIYSETVVYRFYQGVPNCSLVDERGVRSEAININGLTVCTSLSPPTKELGKNGCVLMTVVNETSAPVSLLPKAPVMIVLAPKVVLSHIVDASALANKVEKKGNKSAKWVRFWGADATTPVTTTFIGHPGVWGYSPIVSYNNMPPMISRSGNMTTMTTQVPDYAAQARALQKAANLEQKAQQEANSIRESSLGGTTVPPGGTVSGTLYFDESNIQKAILQIPIGNASFEFPFPPD